MSYFEWVEQLQKLETTPMDYELLESLKDKKLDGNDYVLERFLSHLVDTIHIRLNNSYYKCVDRILNNNLDTNILSMELINVKKEKKYVLKMTELPLIPIEFKKVFKEIIDKKYDEINYLLKSKIEYIDINGEYISIFENIMLSDMEG